MAECRFYHLIDTPLAGAITMLAGKTFSRQMKSLVILNDAKTAKQTSKALWAAGESSFLAHTIITADKLKAEDPVDQQPLLLAMMGADLEKRDAELDQLIKAHKPEVVIWSLAEPWPQALLEWVQTPEKGHMICDLFEGNHEASLAQARLRWKAGLDFDVSLSYWQQTPQGGWQQKHQRPQSPQSPLADKAA